MRTAAAKADTTLAALRARALRALIPPPRLRLSDWIEREISLPEGVSALPGRVRLWPYQRDIADAISDPEIERVTLVKPVRVGFTTLLTGAIGSYIANEPAPILVLLPTAADCRDYVVSDVEPVSGAPPALRASRTSAVFSRKPVSARALATSSSASVRVVRMIVSPPCL